MMSPFATAIPWFKAMAFPLSPVKLEVSYPSGIELPHDLIRPVR
jgi:hypothetical protein